MIFCMEEEATPDNELFLNAANSHKILKSTQVPSNRAAALFMGSIYPLKLIISIKRVGPEVMPDPNQSRTMGE